MEENKQEDLDLMAAIGSLKKALFNVFKFFIWIFDFSYKNLKGLLVFIALCMGIGLALFYLNKPYYKSELSMSHIRIENDYCFELLKSLNSYINEKDGNTGLATKLRISQSAAKQVKSIRYKAINDNIEKKFVDSAVIMLPFKVDVEVYDMEVLDTLQQGVLFFLESNEFASKRKQIDLEEYIKTEERVKSEIREIDSLKLLVNQAILPRNAGNGFVFGEPVDPVNVYRRAMELYDKHMLLKKKALLNNSFELIVGFNRSNKPANPGKLIYLFIGACIGYIIGIIYLVKKKH